MHGLGETSCANTRFSPGGRSVSGFRAMRRLVIHNAAFDMKFINAELKWLASDDPVDRAVDTLEIARRKFPGSPGVAGCAVPAIRHRQLGPHPAWRAARFADPGRGLSRTDRRPAAGFGSEAGGTSARRMGRTAALKDPRTGAPTPGRCRSRLSPMPRRDALHRSFCRGMIHSGNGWGGFRLRRAGSPGSSPPPAAGDLVWR